MHLYYSVIYWTPLLLNTSIKLGVAHCLMLFNICDFLDLGLLASSLIGCHSNG